MKINVKVLMPEFFERHGLPRRATEGSAGLDIRYASYVSIPIYPNQAVMVPTGLAIEVPESVVMLLVPRSGLGSRGLVLGNLVGVIDPDYRDEVKVSLWNRSDETIYLTAGDRVCQALFMPFHPVVLNEVTSLSQTDRTGGHGSTGVQ